MESLISGVLPLCVLEGSTPLNKLSIGIHTNIALRNRNSTPHVTIF